ncbi:MAG: hypothetical protein EZS28_039754, partial [Streblomastix strix]
SYAGLISLFGMWIRVGAILTETTVLKLRENQRMKALKNMWKVGSNDVRCEVRKWIM